MDGTEQTQNNADSARQITLTEFLLARIAEDEGRAQKAQRYAGNELWVMGPMRVLTECAAKRRIVEYAQARAAQYEADRKSVGARVGMLTADDVLYDLAAIYSDHRDYDPEWAL